MLYYGEETKHALENFPLENQTTDLKLIYALTTVKKAAAQTYLKLNIEPEKYKAIIQACDEIYSAILMTAFPPKPYKAVPVLQLI